MPDPKLINDESGIVEGSDEHLEYDLFDDYDPDAGTAAAIDPSEAATRNPPTEPAETQPASPAQPAVPQSNVDALKERQLATTVIPALQNENKALQEKINATHAELASFKELQTDVQRFGLTPQEAQIGFQLASSWKSNPAETIQKLLTYAASKGISVEGAPAPAVTRDMLASIVEEKLAPVLQKARQEEAQQAQQLEASREATTFLTDYPDAVVHQDSIAVVMQKYNLTPQKAYMELYKYAASNGLDWNQPLAEQIQAKQNNPRPTITPQRSNYSPGVRQADALPVQEVNYASEDTSYRNIVDSVLAEYGVPQ